MSMFDWLLNLDASQSLSSNDSSGASLMLGRKGLKIQGPLLTSPQTPTPGKNGDPRLEDSTLVGISIS